MVSAVETGKLQERIDRLKTGMRQLMVIKKKLRAAVSKCEHGIIEGYPNLEFTNIDEFIHDLMESTETLVVNVDRAVKSYRRIAKVQKAQGQAARARPGRLVRRHLQAECKSQQARMVPQ